MELFNLAGKTAIITGSTKGIGKAMAEEMAAHGAHVVISSRKGDVCDEVAEAIRAKGHKATAIPCNVSHKDQLQALVDKTRADIGPIDILCCNAAVNPYYGSFMDIPDSAFEKILGVNVMANHHLIQMVAPEMMQRKDGAIIVVSSIGGLKASDTIGAYCISKAADMQMVRNLAEELSPHNIRVNCIAPGLVKTDFARALWENPEQSEHRINATPMRRLGEPRDLAGIGVYLASQAGAWTTGQTFVIDGGVTISGR